ncbi:MAG: hypothetical protein A2Y93_09600 [Chloroflexi bacterium RBG_13_68_17]|nr:MAG: hypothetical protein A2Y93_09600 [Chloroflexi bacterium RBG_13_68_17]
MDRRTAGLLATIAASLLCGCPGTLACLFGAMSAFGPGDTAVHIGPLRSWGRIDVGTSLLLRRRRPMPVADPVPPAS